MKAQKPGLHPRNRHHQRYDLPALCQAHPDLQGYITLNPLGEQTIDFANPQAVKALNKALLAPYSFFNCFNYRPPIIGFASSGWKDSVRNIVETKEFVWNLATRPLAEAMNETSASIPHHEDEFVRAGLTAAASRLVKAPRVAESPVNFECRLSQCIQLATADGNLVDTWLVLGEVVAVHIDESLLDNGIYQTARAQPILRAGGPSAYYSIDDSLRFDMIRPDAR